MFVSEDVTGHVHFRAVEVNGLSIALVVGLGHGEKFLVSLTVQLLRVAGYLGIIDSFLRCFLVFFHSFVVSVWFYLWNERWEDSSDFRFRRLSSFVDGA